MHKIFALRCAWLKRLLYLGVNLESGQSLIEPIRRRDALWWPHQLLLHPANELLVWRGLVDQYIVVVNDCFDSANGRILRFWDPRENAVDNWSVYLYCWITVHVYCSVRLNRESLRE